MLDTLIKAFNHTIFQDRRFHNPHSYATGHSLYSIGELHYFIHLIMTSLNLFTMITNVREAAFMVKGQLFNHNLIGLKLIMPDLRTVRTFQSHFASAREG